MSKYKVEIDALKNVVEKLDWDGVFYQLSQIAVERRNEADEGDNKAEKKFCQQVVEILSDAQRKLEEV